MSDPERAWLRWDEKVDPPITDRVKLPVINALDGAITTGKEIDLEEEYQFSHEEGTKSEASES